MMTSMEKKHIIAILGMPGSGKTEAIEYLEETYRLPKVYFGQITINEVLRRGLPVNPVNERNVREELRARNGKDYYANEVMVLIDAITESESVLVESLYSWTEYQTFKRQYGDRLHTISIHASPTLRHERLTTRPIRPLTISEAEVRDVAQLEQLEQGGPIALADHVVVNEGTLEEMTGALDRIMQYLGIAKA
jgi:dephospho-CoA kinase